MLLSDVFMHLGQGELAHISTASDNNGIITEQDYPLLISHINLALIDLYTRLPLKQSQVLINQVDNLMLYPLSTDHALSNPTSTVPFILDSPEKPFQNDVLKIEEVYLEDGTALPLNDQLHPDSVFTPSPYTLQIPSPESGMLTAVIYRAKHPQIKHTSSFDPSTVEVELPTHLLEPLMLYVVARMVRSRGTTESLSEANALMGRYEQILMMHQQVGVTAVDRPSNYRLERNGWV